MARAQCPVARTSQGAHRVMTKNASGILNQTCRHLLQLLPLLRGRGAGPLTLLTPAECPVCRQFRERTPVGLEQARLRTRFSKCASGRRTVEAPRRFVMEPEPKFHHYGRMGAGGSGPAGPAYVSPPRMGLYGVNYSPDVTLSEAVEWMHQQQDAAGAHSLLLEARSMRIKV